MSLPILLSALLAAAAAAAVAVQLALPRIAARRIGNRLTEGGGSAAVTVESFPAPRLLANRGDRLVVRGRGLVIGLGDGDPGGSGGLQALDGFEAVDVEIVGLRAGPFEVAAFVLVRRRGGPYAMAAEGTVTGADLAGFGEAWLRRSVPGGALIGAVAGSTPIGARRVPVAIEVELHSGPEGLRVGAGGGRIAGYPAGPIAAAIAAGVARRLEIAP